MKVAVCCLNSKYIHSSLAPWYLNSALTAENFADIESFVIEGTVNESTDEIIKRIFCNNPQVITFSCYIWNINKTLELCRMIKERSTATVILGGPEVSYNSITVLAENPFIDYILCGEGEETYPLLMRRLKDSADIRDISGITYREREEIFHVPEKENRFTPVSPYTDDYFKNLNGRIAYIEASRGCPYRCAFCLSGRNSPLRHFNFEQVKEDIIRLSESGTKTIKFIDRTFNADVDKANRIISFILDNHGSKINKNVCFHFEIAGDILKDSTMELFKKAPTGLFQLEIGIQSFNEKTLKAINRKTNLKKLSENIEKLLSFKNIHIHIDLIAGLPEDDFQSFRESFNKAYMLNAHMLQLGFLKLLHGSDMRNSPNSFPCTYNPLPPYEVTETPTLTAKDIRILKNCEDALDRLYNSGRFTDTLDYLVNECKIEPFQLFSSFGNMINGTKMPLADYALHFYEHFKDLSDKDLLKEMILTDLLSCSSSLQIPPLFKTKDPLYRRTKAIYTDGTADRIKVAVLRNSGKILVVNQSGNKDLRGRYPSHKIDITSI